MRKNILKEIFDKYIESNGNGASEQIFRSKENGKTYRVAFEKYTENGVMENSVIKLVNIDDKTDKKTYTAFGSIDINGECILEPIENTNADKELEDGVFLTNGEIVFAYKKTDDTIRGYHSYVSVYIYDSTPMSRMSNAFVFNKDKVCLNDVCYPYSKKLRKATPDEIEEFRDILDSYGYVYKDHEVLFKKPIEEGEYINISGISVNGERCYFIAAQPISSPLMKSVLVYNDDYSNKDAIVSVEVAGLITRVDKTIGDAFFSILNQKDVYWDGGLKSFVVKETPKEKLDEINRFKNTYIKRLEGIWEDEKKKAVECAQKTRELLKKKVVDDTNGEVEFSEVKKLFETENTLDDSKCADEQTYGRVTTKIINLIKNTPLTNEELKKINDVVFDAILSNTSKGAENGKRTESQRN